MELNVVKCGNEKKPSTYSAQAKMYMRSYKKGQNWERVHKWKLRDGSNKTENQGMLFDIVWHVHKRLETIMHIVLKGTTEIGQGGNQ